jgi:hypothetical protein
MALASPTSVLQTLTRPPREVDLDLVDEHFPLMLMRWSGHLQAPQVLQLIRFFDDGVARGLREQRRVLHICDARHAEVPDQLVRDMLIDWLIETTHEQRKVMLGSFVVASDPLVRGVVASLKWATGRGGGIRVVAELETAIDGACELLEGAGLEVPEVLRPRR